MVAPVAHHEIHREALKLHGEWLSLSRARPAPNPQTQHELRQRVLQLTATGFRTAPWTHARDFLAELNVSNVELISLIKEADTRDDVRRREFLMPFLKRAVLVLSAYDFVMGATLNMTFTIEEYVEIMDTVNAMPTNDSVYAIAERQERLAIMLAILSHSKYAYLVGSLMEKYDISLGEIQEFESRPYYAGLWQSAQNSSKAA